MGDDATRHHVGAVADPRRIVPDRRGRDTEFLQVVEPADPGLIAPDPGIVEDRRRGPELRREIGGVDPAMRGVNDDRAARLCLGDAGDAVGNDDRRGGGGHVEGSEDQIAGRLLRRFAPRNDDHSHRS